ncbi:MAG: hypothetical protein DRP85_07420 [Candidatus Makaraimicrobium thalassicum]|nr:MAG: hypothetical protein DRP85_07420 [Candidatus Omnitrophota bacterium]
MKKMKVLILSMMLYLMCMGTSAFAASENIDCFEYYKFQSGLEFNDLHAEKVSYAPGDDVRVFYNLLSHMDVPIVEGKVRVQMFYDGDDAREEMIDEFFDARDVSLYPDEKVPLYFKWSVPENAKAGKYTVKMYFVVGAMFNLCGISMLPYGPPGVPGEMTSFDVVNEGAESRIYFDKDSTTLNGRKYTFGTFAPTFDESTPISIKTKIVNEGTLKKQVSLMMNIYEWDDLTERPMAAHTQEKKVLLAPGASVDVSYDVGALVTGAYEVKFIATSASQNAILKMRFAVGGEKGGIGYLGIDKFPFEAGDEVTVFSCVSNTADYSSTFLGHGTVEIMDKNGKTVFTDTLDEMSIVADPMGMKWTFSPTESLNYLKLRMRLYDTDNNIVNEAMLTYDYSKFRDVPKVFSVEADKSNYKQGDALNYKVSFKDERGTSLRGDVVAYIVAPDGNIIHRVKDARIDGVFENSIKLHGDEGTYKIVAREVNHDLFAETSVALAAGKVVAVDDGSDEPNMMPVVLLVALVAVVLGVMVVMVMRRGKK